MPKKWRFALYGAVAGYLVMRQGAMNTGLPGIQQFYDFITGTDLPGTDI